MRNGYLASYPTASLATANNYASQNLITNNLKNNIYGVADNQVVVDGNLTSSSALYDDFNWQDYITRTGAFQKYDVDYSGGDDKTTYFAGFGYNKETGYVIKSDFERYNARVSVQSQVTDWLKLGTNLTGSLVKSNQAEDGEDSSFVNPFYFTRVIGPIYSPFLYDSSGNLVYDSEGNIEYDGNSTRGRGSSASSGRNVLQETLLNNQIFDSNSINSRFNAEFKLAKGLTFQSNLGYDVRNTNLKSYGNKTIGDAAGVGTLSITNYKYQGTTFNQIFNYNISINKNNFDLTAGHESYDRTVNYSRTSKENETVSGIYELINFLTTRSATSYDYIIKREGYFARLNYDYNNKYMLSASVRLDKSSRFSPENNKGVFWSIGGGWNISKEDFLKGSSFVNDLKLRASYGQVGNDGGNGEEPGYQADLDLYTLGYNNAGENGALLGQVGNKDLTWETKNQLDLGIDFSILNRRISGSIDYYLQDVDDMIFAVPVPNSAGVPDNSIYQNIGKMRNQGLELSLNLGIVRNEKFSWDFSIIAATNSNKVLKLANGENGAFIKGTKRIAEGHSLYDFWLRQWYGVDSSDGSALYLQDEKVTDDSNTRTINGTKVTTNYVNAKYDYSGSSLPDVYGSLTNSFKIGNFDANIMLNYQLGGKTYDSNYAILMSSYPQGQAIHVDMLNAWKKTGDITNVPIMSTTNVTNASAASTRWLVSSDYLTIRTVQFGYNFKKETLSQIGLTNLRIYLSGENLYSWTARKGLEPAQSFNGTTTYRYTPSRTVSVGLNVSF